MGKLTNFGSAFGVAMLVAAGMVAFNAPLFAAGSGGSQTALCRLLANAEAAAETLPDSELKTALLASIDEQQASLGCE